MRTIGRQIHLTVAVALAAPVLVGCGSSTIARGPDGDTAITTSQGASPEFEGPYAAEFTEFYSSARSDFVRTVLADGIITDAEYAEMTERFRSCLADQGITFDGFRQDGSFTTSLAPGGGDTHEVVTGCAATSGQDVVGALHDLMTANPDNVDAAVAITTCLVDSGEVPATYTAKDYKSDREGRFRDTEQLEPALAQALDVCMTDPFGTTESR